MVLRVPLPYYLKMPAVTKTFKKRRGSECHLGGDKLQRRNICHLL